jgi:hypothetical protein
MKRRYLQNLAIGMSILLMMFFHTNKANGQEKEWNTWTGIELNKKITKKLDFSLSPEIRFTDQYKVDEYFIEAGLEYKILKFLKAGFKYRYLVNERETKSTEYFNRIAFDLKGKYELNRFDFQLRTRYTNFNELDTDDSSDNYLRYRLKMKYDIPKSKITPVAGIELFHHLKDQEINKVRYFMGADYKINKHHKIGLNFMTQDYLNDDTRKNIIALKYKISF